jgi:hypothetical protein
MSIRKILIFVVLAVFVTVLWHGITKGEFEETRFNGNLL